MPQKVADIERWSSRHKHWRRRCRRCWLRLLQLGAVLCCESRQSFAKSGKCKINFRRFPSFMMNSSKWWHPFPLRTLPLLFLHFFLLLFSVLPFCFTLLLNIHPWICRMQSNGLRELLVRLRSIRLFPGRLTDKHFEQQKEKTFTVRNVLSKWIA